MKNVTSYATDWNNVDLNNDYQRSQNILEPYSFDTLLLEIHCNILDQNLNKVAIIAQFEKELQSKIREAREIFKANLDNIENYAIEQKQDLVE